MKVDNWLTRVLLQEDATVAKTATNLSANLSSTAKPGLNKNAYISTEDKSAESAITERT